MMVKQFNPLDPNLKFTPEACRHIEKQLAKNTSAIGIRISVKTTGCSGLSYVTTLVESFESDDVAIETHAAFTAKISAKALPYLTGSTVDLIQQALGQSKLVFDNPNESARCGCGESFSIDKSDDTRT